MKAFAIWSRRKAVGYVKSESGAVTVDWVVLTAAICGMVIGLFNVVTAAVYEDTATSISDRIAGAGDLY